jgi:biotin carboxylase
VLKPRSSAAAIGIKRVEDRDGLWRALDDAGDDRAQCVLEQFVPGDVYHVDSIVWQGQVLFAVAFKYGRPPMEISHQGGIFITRRLADTTPDAAAVLALNRRLQEGLGLRRGVSHTEFIAGPGGPGESGAFVFLETSARVGGAFIVETIEAATGVNLWREWAKIEIAGEAGRYDVPSHRDDHAAIILTLARQEAPDMSAYADPEIAVTIRKAFHAGLIVASSDAARVDALIADYSQRFYRDFFATAPPPERPIE